ncbi:MAG TPA: AbrB/MazE/SpoVT family DNA-binding domain-containing protein [Candidatus Nanoarchaeia archaeon]|nr:AbrB/MazE/SpoVT family DNA-binding domain-containing protein [Candidatus Nanoarchaeia archaeon]
MVQTIQRVKKIGGSLMVRIPKDLVQMEHIQAGESLELDIRKLRKDYFGAFPGLKPFTKEDRMRSKYE